MRRKKKYKDVNNKGEYLIPRNHLALAPVLQKGRVHLDETSPSRSAVKITLKKECMNP